MVSSGIKHKIIHLYEENKRTNGKYSYTIPSSDTYPYQWFWDSCFAAITMTYFDIPRAKDELRSLVSKQFDNGMIPHMIYWEKAGHLPQLEIKWGKRRTSSITQPPLLAEAVHKIYETDGDLEFVNEMLPHIHSLHQFLYRQRDPRKSGLVGIINPDESGEDTSPRFDEALAIPEKQSFDENYGSRMSLIKDWREARFVVKKRMDLKYWVRDLPFNAILYRSLTLTSRLAAISGKHSISDWSHEHATKTKNAIVTELKDDGYYVSTIRYGESLKNIGIKTWALFMPLYANIATKDEAAELVSLLHDINMFAAPWGIPTVAINESSFNLEAVWPWPNWRGPIWMAPHWFIVKGLRNYGYDNEANQLQERSLALLTKSGFREFYNPFSGEGYGAKGFIWGGLVLDM